jgi:hypothetical protein
MRFCSTDADDVVKERMKDLDAILRNHTITDMRSFYVHCRILALTPEEQTDVLRHGVYMGSAFQEKTLFELTRERFAESKAALAVSQEVDPQVHDFKHRGRGDV